MNYWVSAVDARNREYAQLMRKFQVEANLHDTSKRSLSEQFLAKQELQVCLRVRYDRPTARLTPKSTQVSACNSKLKQDADGMTIEHKKLFKQAGSISEAAACRSSG